MEISSVEMELPFPTKIPKWLFTTRLKNVHLSFLLQNDITSFDFKFYKMNVRFVKNEIVIFSTFILNRLTSGNVINTKLLWQLSS